MKLRLDLLLCAVLIASAGTELVAPGALYAAEAADQRCRTSQESEGTTRIQAIDRILAEGYTEVRIVTKGCDNSWHALALADGDPVNLRVTPQGTVQTE